MAYGLTHKSDLRMMAMQVCECLGNGANNKAVDLLLETAGAETGRGTVKDLTIEAGMGITQIDKLPFKDIKDRCRKEDRVRIYDFFNIDIDMVEWEHLRYNPLLCFIFTRLKYKKVPSLIPLKFDDRAEYWKTHYNTVAGKGTVSHYIYANLPFLENMV